MFAESDCSLKPGAAMARAVLTGPPMSDAWPEMTALYRLTRFSAVCCEMHDAETVRETNEANANDVNFMFAY